MGWNFRWAGGWACQPRWEECSLFLMFYLGIFNWTQGLKKNNCSLKFIQVLPHAILNRVLYLQFGAILPAVVRSGKFHHHSVRWCAAACECERTKKRQKKDVCAWPSLNIFIPGVSLSETKAKRQTLYSKKENKRQFHTIENANYKSRVQTKWFFSPTVTWTCFSSPLCCPSPFI